MDIQIVLYWVGLTIAMPIFWYALSQWIFNTTVEITNRNLEKGIYSTKYSPAYYLAFNFAFFSILLCTLYMGLVAAFFFVIF